LLVALLVALFATTRGGLDVAPPAPIEELTVERIVLTPGVITVHVRNTGPDELTVALVNINDSTWPATASPSNAIPRLGTAAVALHYPWVTGEAYSLAFVTANSVVFHASIPVAFATAEPTLATVGSFALIGLYVGLLPIAIGMLWLPALRRAGPRTILFLIAFTAGILLVLAVDTLVEAIEQSAGIATPFQGPLLILLGVVVSVGLLTAVDRGAEKVDRKEASERWRIAYVIALGIGLHNLGEGLAIGAAYSVGELALGAFLVIGFILQNVTEGVAIVVPILKQAVRLRDLALLAFVAGVPAIAGTLIGAFTYSAVLATLFLALGAGAILQVLLKVGQMALRDSERLRAPSVGLAGVVAGMLVLYVTGLLVK
jgi:ZIP family zinc transporter